MIGSPILTIAGLWDEWKNREIGERLKSGAMIICEPKEFGAEIHDRMPVLFKPDQFDHWLSGNIGVGELKAGRTITFKKKKNGLRGSSKHGRIGKGLCAVPQSGNLGHPREEPWFDFHGNAGLL